MPERTDSFYKKPRTLYGAVFVWIAITGGRFVTTFLEHECYLSGSAIAFLFAVQQLVGLPANTWAGQTADKLEQRYPGYGRSGTVAIGCTLGTICFILHGTSRLSSHAFYKDFIWFLILRICYALATSLVFPVLDGMCLQYLDDKPQEYGKERLWGAVTWAVTNVLLGPALDRVGFGITYPLGVVTYLVVLASLYVYTINASNSWLLCARPNLYSVVAIPKRNSDVQLTDMSTSESADCEGDESASIERTIQAPQQQWKDCLGSDHERNEEADWDEKPNADTAIIPTKELVRGLLFGLSPWYYGCCFILAVTLLASGQVIVDSLIFLFFEDLGSSYTIMGWTVVLTVLFEIPVFSVADQLLDRLGSTTLLLTAMVCYIVRVLGYTIIPTGHVVYALLVEPMHGVTYACSQTAVVDFVAQSMPVGYEATGQALVYVVRGLGNVVGLLMGGWAEGTVGPRVLYRSAAAVVSTGCLVLGLAWYGQYRQRHARQRVSNTTADDLDDIDERRRNELQLS